MEPLITTPKLIELLSSYAWTSDREVSIPEWLMEMPPESHAMCAASEKILRHLEDVRIDVYSDPMGPVTRIDFLMHPDNVEDAQDWSKMAGEQLFALGLADAGDFLVNEDGACFVGFGDLWRIGDNIDEALRNCLFGEKEWTLIA